uniref:DSBA-like thioredoxin domain-containing protein n=1 Tax=Alexandrium catenella TaxID=2925 RepID=A0A7S1S665_ALECA|mmetsp:Transcript_87347/g.232038  ORF Transcript_87347/g.232038 Transcript_87347/m.232038 type:complete len:210 (+) Transcript_87347:179-808(+)
MARAGEELGLDFQVAWHPYFLDPSLPAERLSKRDNYRRRGLGEGKLAKLERKMTELFRAEGLRYTLEGETGSTMDSHRLAAWVFTKYGAEEQDRFVDALFRRHFSEGQSPSDPSSLLGAAEEAGLDVPAARRLLESGAGREGAARAAADVAEMVTGVPHYFLTVEGTQSEEKPRGLMAQVPGAQDADTFFLVFRGLAQKARDLVGAAKL